MREKGLKEKEKGNIERKAKKEKKRKKEKNDKKEIKRNGRYLSKVEIEKKQGEKD